MGQTDARVDTVSTDSFRPGTLWSHACPSHPTHRARPRASLLSNNPLATTAPRVPTLPTLTARLRPAPLVASRAKQRLNGPLPTWIARFAAVTRKAATGWARIHPSQFVAKQYMSPALPLILS